MISWHWFVPSVDLVKFEAQATPSVELGAQLAASATADESWEFWDHDFPFASFPIGPVDITPALHLKLDGHISAEGKVTLDASAMAGEQLDVGFIYTKQQGAKPISGATFVHHEDLKLSGEASIKASVSCEMGLVFKIYDIGGPQFSVTPELGAEADAKMSETWTPGSTEPSGCTGELEADFFANLSESVGVYIDLDFWSYEKNFTLGEQSWYFPSNKWTYPIPNPTCPQQPDAGSPCPQDKGGEFQECHPSSGGCASGLGCVALVSGLDLGRCLQPCSSSGDCHTLATTCGSPPIDGGSNVCNPNRCQNPYQPCDAVGSGDGTCVPFPLGESLCFQGGSAPLGNPCGFSRTAGSGELCQVGSVCLAPPGSPSCVPPSSGMCATLCDSSGSGPSCSGSDFCDPIILDGGYGACILGCSSSSDGGVATDGGAATCAGGSGQVATTCQQPAGVPQKGCFQ